MTTVVSYGAGTNSTALLIGLYERGERPDLILFADTGGERPETYRHRDSVSEWCKSVGFPEIVTVVAPNKSLETDCIDRKALPAIAYGFKTCSMRWKVQPQEKWLRQNGHKDIIKLIGIDADETHRVKDYPDTRYPLVEWGWGRDECIEAISRAGIPQPGKSACFFCPSSKPQEILQLGRTHPELLARALEIEFAAHEKPRTCFTCGGTGKEIVPILADGVDEFFLNENDDTTDEDFAKYVIGEKETTCHTCQGSGILQPVVKGLGRSFAWADLVKFNDAQLSLIPDYAPEIPCGCYDG